MESVTRCVRRRSFVTLPFKHPLRLSPAPFPAPLTLLRFAIQSGACKCDQGWTGLDCSTKCLPCVHGDCQMDGYCYCRPHWTLPDCSKHLGPDIVRAEFTDGSEGWASYNNSCPAQARNCGGCHGEEPLSHPPYPLLPRLCPELLGLCADWACARIVHWPSRAAP